MEFIAKTFDELSTVELYEIARARTEIFLMEQRIVCRDLDGVDYKSLHCFFYEGDKVVAYLRAFKNDERENEAVIGRVLSMTHGIGLGKALMKKSIPEIKKHFSPKRITLHSQKLANGFYEKLGFSVCSDEFLEEGVVHVEMELVLD